MYRILMLFLLGMSPGQLLGKTPLIYMIPKLADGSLGPIEVSPANKVSFPLPDNMVWYWFDVDGQVDFVQGHKDAAQATYNQTNPELFSYPKSELHLGDTEVKGIYNQPRLDFELGLIPLSPSLGLADQP